MSTDSRLSHRRRRFARPGGGYGTTATPRVYALFLAVTGLFLAMTWMLDLESTLPDIRSPRDTGSSEVLRGHGLMSPGIHRISSVDADVEGEWLLQQIGDSDWLATDQAGSSVRAAFYGTELYLLARVGPDAGRAYVMVNNRPVATLPQDESGSFTNLWAIQAADRPIRVASGLAHGEHLVEVTAAGEGEVAIAGFNVIAQTPFPWAFVLGYAGITGGLLFAIRQLLYALSPASSDAPSSPARTQSNSEFR